VRVTEEGRARMTAEARATFERADNHPASAYRNPDEHATVLFNQAGQPAGHIDGTVLRKRVDIRRHQLRVPPAWATDEAILLEAEACGARTVELMDEQGTMWTAPLAAFFRDGIGIDRGFGAQRALPLQYWSVRSTGQAPLWEDSP
jgi:hypothetical protein